MRETTRANTVILIYTYDTHLTAAEAVKELKRSGFDMKQVSIVGKHYHGDEPVSGSHDTGGRMKYWRELGAFWNGRGWLVGEAFFVIPGVGPISVAGPLVAWIVGALEGAVAFGGLSAIGASLSSFGVPKDSALKMELALKADKFLVVAHGTAGDVAKARAILSTARASDVLQYPDAAAQAGGTG